MLNKYVKIFFNDIDEKNNLVDKHPQKVGQMRNRLKTIVSDGWQKNKQ